MKTRAYPVSDTQCNRIRLVINTRRCKQSLRIASLNIGTSGETRELEGIEKLQSDTRGVSCNTAQDAGNGDEGCQEKDESKRKN